MKVKRIVSERPVTPQCEAIRVTQYANDRHDTNRQCKHSSSFIVDGKHLCKRHAEQTVMKAHLAGAKP